MKNSKKICLAWHNIDSTNFGVSALAIAQIKLLIKAAEAAGVQIFIETLGTPSNKNLYIKKEVEELYNIKIIHSDFSLKYFLTSILKLNFNGINQFKKYDIIMDIGEGDSFTDIYGFKRFFRLCTSKLSAIYLKKKLILSPQTYGPFKSIFNQKVASWIMNRSEMVFSRDYKSTEFLNKIGIECTEVSDVAFMLPFERIKVKENTVGINVSGLLWNGGYTQSNQFGLTINYQKMIIDIIDGFIERGKTVHLVGHVIADDFPVEDDYKVCQDIKGKYLDSNKVVLAPKFNSPLKAKSYMSQLEFFTGSRMHATIGALSASVVTVPIAYSRKFSGVFGALDYNYTLNAYEMNTAELVGKLFEYYDNKFDEMQLSMDNALKIANTRNANYVNRLTEILKSE
jgi:polysaccharide pyruvyl transferase WcaK-like protein